MSHWRLSLQGYKWLIIISGRKSLAKNGAEKCWRQQCPIKRWSNQTEAETKHWQLVTEETKMGKVGWRWSDLKREAQQGEDEGHEAPNSFCLPSISSSRGDHLHEKRRNVTTTKCHQSWRKFFIYLTYTLARSITHLSLHCLIMREAIKKITGETSKLCSDKRKQREERKEIKKRKKRETNVATG